MNTTDRWRVAIFAGLLVLAAGLAGLVVWKGAPFIKNMRNGLRWQKEMRAVVSQRAQIEANWSSIFGPLEEFPKRHPVTDDNETARKLDAELAEMDAEGLIRSQHPAPGAQSAPADREQRERRKQRNDQLSEFLTRRMEQPDDEMKPLPAMMVEYLNRNAGSFARIRVLLTRAPPPIWRADYRNTDSPIPNLGSFLNLDRWLVADALQAAAENVLPRAMADLHAAAVLHQALARRPELVAILVAMAAERYRLGVIRILALRSGIAPLLAESFDPQAAMREAKVGEMWQVDRFTVEQRAEQLKKMAGHPIARYFPPPDNYILDAWRLDTMRFYTAFIPAITRTDDCSPVRGHDPAMNPAEWNIAAVIYAQNSDTIGSRYRRLALEREMTQKLLILSRVATPAESVLALPADFADSGCKKGRWRVEKSADGQSITLRFSEPIDWGKNVKGAHIPLQFTLHQLARPAVATKR